MDITRRRLLQFLGASGGAAALDVRLPSLASADPVPGTGGLGALTPLRLPHQLPVFAAGDSYLPSSGTSGAVGAHGGPQTSYTIFDDVVLSPQLERYVIVAWGDNVYPDLNEYFGYNADYTAFVSRTGKSDGYLWVNHEYVSSPMSYGAPEAPAALAAAVPQITASALAVIDIDLDAPTTSQLLRWGEYAYNMGGSVVRIQKRDGRYGPVKQDAHNRRYHLLSGLLANEDRTDVRQDGTAYSTITSWGTVSYQQGDDNYLIGTGPAAVYVFPTSTDGLGNKIIGTGFNCSGSSTPWGTILSAEENFQATPGAFFVGVNENVDPAGHQLGYLGSGTYTDARSGQTFLNYTTGTFFGQVGEKYGYMVEIDPADPAWRARKHSALGRFRHENIGLRANKGEQAVAYMGDDRRGGHVWRFVSDGTFDVRSGRDANSALFEHGTLYVARFNADGTGTWIPLVLSTPVNPTPPSSLAAGEAAGRGVAVSTITQARVKLPKRAGVAGQSSDGGPFDVFISNEATAIPSYLTKGGTVPGGATLGDYYTSQGAVVVDAFLAANLVGGTPCGRPEDLEVLPSKPHHVFIACTDGVPGSDGYPDSRVFVVGKYSSALNATQGSGGLYRITEDDPAGAGLTFHWDRFLQGGEAGAVDGAGFATVDNLAFDDDGNLWGVIDMSTSAHNGFNLTYTGTTLQPGQTSIDHTTTSNSGLSNLFGIYGCNWLFHVPLSGPDAGAVIPVGYGPPRCEMTGPTFLGDHLLLAVQHPGEDSPINGDPNAGGDAASVLTRSIEVLDLNGETFSQSRTLPRGSNWPSNIAASDGGADDPTGPPRPAVIGIRPQPS